MEEKALVTQLRHAERRLKRLQAKRSCYICGKKRDFVWHHLNGDHHDNRAENLVTLCQGCHSRVHHTYGENPTTLQELEQMRPEVIAQGSRLRLLVHQELTAMGRSKAALEHWPTIAARFEQCCGYKDTYERADLIKFLGWEREKGFTQTSIDQHLKAIKLIARVQGWEFPKLTMPRVNPDDIRRTTFTTEQVISLIQMGRKLAKKDDVPYLALATTYGLRREEMSRLRPKDITPNTITIQTAKGGRRTTHLIPEEIKPHLASFRPFSPDYVSHLFLRILRDVGMRVGAGYGWHSVRRALVTELLLREANAVNLMRFMRWSDASMRSDFGMLRVYAKKDQARIDQEIFKIHPFLPYWRE